MQGDSNDNALGVQEAQSVSSLLSRFESMRQSQAASGPVPSAKAPPRPKPKPQALQMPRASLDYERPASLDLSRTSSPTPKASRGPPPPLPKQRRAPKQPQAAPRPSSFHPSSPSRPVPAVDVTSPKSPPKLLARSATCRETSSDRSASHSPRAPLRLPPRDQSRSHVTKPLEHSTGVQSNSQDSFADIDRATTPPAPPINRATKPPPSPKLLPKLETSDAHSIQRPGSVPLRNLSPASATTTRTSRGQKLIPSHDGRLSAASLSDTPDNRPILPPRRVSPPPLQASDTATKPSALSQGFNKTSRPAAPTNSARPDEASALTRHQSTVSARSAARGPSVDFKSRPILGRSLSHAVDSLDGSNSSPTSASKASVIKDFPDPSRSNRCAPCFPTGPKTITAGFETRVFDVCGELVCAAGAITKVWSTMTGKPVFSMAHGEHVKVTAVKFRPSRNIEDEGRYLWIGTNWGELQEIDIGKKRVTGINSALHHRREVVKILSCGAEIWTIDDEGKLFVWPADDSGAPSLENGIQNARVPRKQGPATVVGTDLWLASGNEIRVYQPTNDSTKPAVLHTQQALSQPSTGEILCSAVIPGDASKIFFGHSDGKVSVYSIRDYSCLYVHSVSMFRIPCMLGVGDYLWTGNVHGKIFVYDVRSTPWTLKKEWDAHLGSPLHRIVSDETSAWKTGDTRVVSLAVDNVLGVWDGLLQVDWMGEWMEQRAAEYCRSEELSALVLTWNVGACTPGHLKYHEKDATFFQDLLAKNNSPDIVVFGLQELVDLDDKKLTAKSFFKGKQKDEYGHEQLRSVYRAWRDYFSGCLYDSAAGDNSYALVHSASLVGLFTCIFVRSPLKLRLRDVQATEVKTGMGGLHGNKGALVVRFLIDDSSLCFVNCHLAAGQTQTVNRNHDVEVIMDNHILPALRLGPGKAEVLASGGDGSMIMDHEICILNGDLNYRIDTLSRERVIKEAKQHNFKPLLDRDQLLISRSRVSNFRLRAFQEGAITFAPTYKYDVGTDNYDSSEKRRVPAWCDRILWKGGDKVKQRTYERHEVRVSDHRPVSSRLKVQVKSIDAKQRSKVWKRGEDELGRVASQTSDEARLRYLMRIFRISEDEARAQLRR